MLKYMEIEALNSDQVKAIYNKGWSFYTECDCEGTYYQKYFQRVNRIGYIILSDDIDIDYIDDINTIAEYSDDFSNEVLSIINPLKDVCYIYLIKRPEKYFFEQVWTNKGLEKSKEIAKFRYRWPVKYYESKDYDKMHSLIKKHNKKVKQQTEKAIECLLKNGFSVISENFAAKEI